MKNNLFLFLFLVPAFLFAQYPTTGNKARLGYQTTGDGLIWRGVAADTAIKPRTTANAYFQLDTVNGVLRRYIATQGSWQVVGGTPDLSAYLEIADTASMLTNYPTKAEVAANPTTIANTRIAYSNGTNLVGSSDMTYTSNYIRLADGSDYIELDPSNSSGNPELRLWNNGVLDGKISAQGTGINFNTSGIITGHLKVSTGLLSGQISGFNVAQGSVVMVPTSGNPAFINWTEQGVAYKGVLGFAAGSADLTYRSTPSNSNVFDGTERFRVVGATGNFLIGTTTDIPTSILTARSTTKSSSPFPFHTTAESNAITGVAGNFEWLTDGLGPGFSWHNGTRKAYGLESTFNRGTDKRFAVFDANGQVINSHVQLRGTNAAFSVYIGNLAGNTATGTYNTALGEEALKVTSGTSNTGIGAYALFSNIGGADNVAIGVNTLYSNTSGAKNIAIGRNSQLLGTTVGGNVSVGYEAMRNNSGQENFAIGNYALRLNSANNNFAAGNYALTVNSSGTENLAMGGNSLFTNTIGSYNTGIGLNSLYANLSGNYNIGIGIRSLYSISTSQYNVAIGTDAMYNNTGSNNTAIGGNVGYRATSGSGNTFIGYNAFYSTGSNGSYSTNIGIGYEVARNVATGADNNIIIGNSISLPTAGGDNQLVIGNAIFGTGLTGTGTIAAGKIGIKTPTPARDLDIIGELRVSDLTTDTPTRIVGADADGDFGELNLGSNISISGGVLNSKWLSTELPAGDVQINAANNSLRLNSLDTAKFNNAIITSVGTNLLILNPNVGSTGIDDFGGGFHTNINGTIESTPGYANIVLGGTLESGGGQFRMSLGYQSNVSGIGSIGLGYDADADGIAAMAIGLAARADENYEISLGSNEYKKLNLWAGQSGGSIVAINYGTGVKEATDLSKTQSNYIAGFATDGTVLDYSISNLPNGIYTGSGTLASHTTRAAIPETGNLLFTQKYNSNADSAFIQVVNNLDGNREVRLGLTDTASTGRATLALKQDADNEVMAWELQSSDGSGATRLTGDGGNISASVDEGFEFQISGMVRAKREAYHEVTSTTSPDTLSNVYSDNLINQGGTQASFTLVMPPSPDDGQICTITYNNAITTLTLDGNGETIVGSAVTTGVPGSQRKFKYYSGIGWIKLY